MRIQKRKWPLATKRKIQDSQHARLCTFHDIRVSLLQIVLIPGGRVSLYLVAFLLF